MKATIAGVEIEGTPEEIGQLIRGFNGSTSKSARTSTPAATSGEKPAKAAKPSKPVSPAVQKARQLQGQWMGLTRQLKGPDKAKLQKVLQAKGKEAAIAEARRMLNK